MQRIAHQYHSVTTNFDGTLNGAFHTVFATSDNNDCYTYSGMLKQKERGEFVKAMLNETTVNEVCKHWSVIEQLDMSAPAKTILSIWSFKWKHLPDSMISKYKACHCAHRGMQSWDVDNWETFASVVNWMSIRILLMVAKIHGLDTKTIDFVLAFPQDQLDINMFMEIPIRMQLHCYPIENQRRICVFKLNKLLYGLIQALANWYEMLTKGLID